MDTPDHMVGLPWQLAKPILQAASIPFRVTLGASFNRFFTVAPDDWYVTRVKEKEGCLDILLHRPMVASGFEHCREVRYVENLVGKEQE